MCVYGVEDSQGKSSADAFEMFISLLAMRSGEYGLIQWAHPTFLPLIEAAYGECWSIRYARILFGITVAKTHDVSPEWW